MIEFSVKDQSDASENGIYVFNGSGSAMTRATDADAIQKLQQECLLSLTEGTVNADSGHVLTTDGAITVGTTNLSFAQFSGAGQISAGTGMTKTGNTLNVNETVNLRNKFRCIKN